jgi:4-amino-4-deoxy-L-arabinose transferase-like glycosyltransferase
LVVAGLTVLGTAIRLRVADQSVFADETSTWWLASSHGLGGVVSTVHSEAEVTPPLYFVVAWLATRIDLTPELLRLPSLVAGAAAIPLTYVLGLRTVGRGAGLVAAAVVALSPFMIFYSAEARAYELAVVLVILSTLAMLAALDGGRARWWVAYGACSCAAVYTHYTTVFVLGAQLVWLLWAHPEARRSALLANAGAVVGFLPWLPGLINDINSPVPAILSELEPFNAHTVRISLEHSSVGYPFAFPSTRLPDLPGVAALVLLALGVSAAIGAIVLRWVRGHPRPGLANLDRRLLLIVVLALSTPVGEALVSAVGTNVFGTRNLAVAWPASALALGALLVAAGPRLRFAVAALVIASFAIGAAKMLESRFQRPDYRAAARFIDRQASAGDVVVDAAAITPGPLTGIDVAYGQPERVFRAGTPLQRDHPFEGRDPIPPVPELTRRAVAAAAGRRIFVVSSEGVLAKSTATRNPFTDLVIGALPAAYRRVQVRSWPGSLRLAVLVYAHPLGH